eukprot:tig00001049_g6660.t1
MLPTTNAPLAPKPSKFSDYLLRVWKYTHMDFDYSTWQMLYLCVGPYKVYRTTKYHKQTKNQWARDDPAFVVILVYFLMVASVAYAVLFKLSGLLSFLRLISWTILVEFIGFGSLVATLTWWLSNSYLRSPAPHSVEQHVEWLYAFDVHCNAFFPLFVLLYVVQFLFIHILVRPDNFLSALLSNILYVIAFSYYHYITFLGFSILPFLHNTVIFLYPIGGIAVAFLLSMVFGFNACQFVMSVYFS